MVALVVLFGLAVEQCIVHVKRTYRIAHPESTTLVLPPGVIDLRSDRGQELLVQSATKADFELLEPHYVPQIYLSYCGVATGVMSVNALRSRPAVTQASFFDERPASTRSAYRTFFGGMTLVDFKALITSYQLRAAHYHGAEIALERFRSRVKRNLGDPSDLMVVNYARKEVDQKGGGHFSPLVAYHEPSDYVLILDVAKHKYPPVWVPLKKVWRAMNTLDSDSGLTRGFVEIFKE